MLFTVLEYCATVVVIGITTLAMVLITGGIIKLIAEGWRSARNSRREY